MTKIQLRHDTAANWTSINPILAVGEAGFETDTNKIKLGDGTKNYNDLEYLVSNSDISDKLNTDGSNVAEEFILNNDIIEFNPQTSLEVNSELVTINTTDNCKINNVGFTDRSIYISGDNIYGTISLEDTTTNAFIENTIAGDYSSINIGGLNIKNPTSPENYVEIDSNKSLVFNPNNTTEKIYYHTNSAENEIATVNILNNNKQEITHWSFPNSKYVTLNPPTDTVLTAPADGWFFIDGKSTTTSNAYLQVITNGLERYVDNAYANNIWVSLHIPVRANQQITVQYTNITLRNCWFIYANGNAPQ